MIVDPMCGCSLFNPPPKAINLKHRLSSWDVLQEFREQTKCKKCTGIKVPASALLTTSRYALLPTRNLSSLLQYACQPPYIQSIQNNQAVLSSRTSALKWSIFCPKGEHLPDVCSLISQIHKFLDNFAKGDVDYQVIDEKKRSKISLIVYQQQDIWWTVFEIILLL